MLEVLAYLTLIASLVGAIWIWVQFGERIEPGYQYLRETNPVGIAVGIGVLFEGVVVGTFLLVVASMARNLIEIRENTKGSG